MRIFKLTLLVFFTSASLLFSQTVEERDQIVSNYDLNNLQKLKEKLQQQYEERQARIDLWASQNKKDLIGIDDEGKTKWLYDIIDNKPIYRTTYNRNAGIMQGADALWNGGSLGLNIEGQGMFVSVWDGARVLTTHEALTGRVIAGEPPIANGNPTDDNHATHVAGTIIASGPNLNARGVAPQATAVYFNFTNDQAEMIAEAALGRLVSNHSYGIPAQNVPVAFLGRYGPSAQSLDQIIFDAPFYLPVMSAGNSRNRNPAVNPGDSGYDILTGDKVAKNNLVVGATVENLNYTGPTSTVMSSFSSWGPADDGRIKPDISTKGVQTFSSLYTNGNSGYGFLSGTSMAAPAVSGGLLLLQQYYNSLNSVYMRSSTAKGLVLHTAREAGVFIGPDYQFGWGTLDTEAAAIAIRDNGSDVLIDELTLQNGATEVLSNITANNSGKLMVSLSWTDLPSPNPFPDTDATTTDVATPMLVNDLDVVVTNANGTSFFPWSLNPAQPIFPATKTGTNNVDNYERVEIDNPSGAYTITVSHKGNLSNGLQNYSLIVTGADQQTFSTSGPDNLNNLALYPNPANDRFTVAFNNQLSGDTINVEVYDVLGQRVMMNSFDNTGVFEETIDASILNSGIYLVRVGNGVTATTKKLIIE